MGILIRTHTHMHARTLAHINLNHSAIRAHAKPIMLTCKRCRKFYFMKNDERKKEIKRLNIHFERRERERGESQQQQQQQ